jgi:hypothetical protein
MAEKYKFYKTVEGDRWDSISYEMYGTPYKMKDLIDKIKNTPDLLNVFKRLHNK